jgi:hypothetical protein
LVLLTTLISGCIGPMGASSRLKTWNREIENRWVGEGAYVLLRLPWGGVYGLLFLSDVLFFNAVEFWTGKSLIDPVDPARLQRIKELDARRHGPGAKE